MNPKISKKILTKWRKEALIAIKIGPFPPDAKVGDWCNNVELLLSNRILLLTQELLDQHLIKEK